MKSASYAEFLSPTGAAERFYSLPGQPGRSFQDELTHILKTYYEMAPNRDHDFLMCFHLSDITTQAPVLWKMLGEQKAFISLIGQTPTNGARVAMEAWQVCGGAMTNTAGSTCLKLNNYELMLTGKSTLESSGSHDQMQEEFEFLLNKIAAKNGTLKGNVQRTWIYCRDIDNNYAGMVQARNEIFTRHGLTKETHFITSTGIEGKAEIPGRLVSMDSLSLFGHQPGQIEHMNALDMLSPTHVYGVAFERGTRIIYGDRSSYYISGTASIDSHGEVLHTGNVARQTERTLENIAALLNNHQASLSDLKQAVVYLRDPADHRIVDDILAQSPLGKIPYIIVHAPVCRPTWLVEIEGIAVNDKGNRTFADFI